ncbi:MAG TPA: radical SAM protein [Phycisphaerae bacterium]|nr:radical SAM protein [Phycisphaerae bacterium]
MKITLINPCPETEIRRHRHGVGHLGLGYVAACLKRAGHEVHAIDAKTERLTAAAIVERVRGISPRLVGITAMTHEITLAAELCRDIQAVLPETITMVGGPHTTALPDDTLAEFPAIDVAVRGEGEHTACELAAAIDGGNPRHTWSAIAGIAYRDDGRIVRNADRPFIQDLDTLPFPAWDLFPKPPNGWGLYAGRGCPFRCAFCQRVLGSRIRMRSVDNLMAEIEELEARTGQPTSWFQDETFGVNRRWTHELLDRLIERNGRRGRVWRWKANSRANLADRPLYRKMKQAGCTMLDFGIESGNPQILRRIHKNITPTQARQAIAAARSAGLKTNAFFIIGHPGETWATALQTVRFAPLCGADSIAVGVMVPYPGTEIWNLAVRRQWGYRLLSRDWRLYDKYFGDALASRHLSHREMELLQSLTYLAFYVGRGRIRELAGFVSRFRREAVQMARRLLPIPA